jgi:hypothetical protein
VCCSLHVCSVQAPAAVPTGTHISELVSPPIRHQLHPIRRDRNAAISGYLATVIGVAIHLNQPPLSSPMYQLVCRWKGKYGTWRKGSEKDQAEGSEASGSQAPRTRRRIGRIG